MNENQKPDTGMAKLFLAVAKTMPEEMLFEQLEKAISEYKSQKSESSKKHLMFYLQMAAITFMHEDESIEESLASVDKIASMVERDKLINT